MNNQKLMGNQWITQCNPDTKITDLVIPGTHDSMTADCNERYYKTQTFSLTEQLKMGVRFLDIRLRKEMIAAHREWISNITAQNIFEICDKFLKENPGEFILMRIQNANEKKDDYDEYGKALLEVISKYQDLFYKWPNTKDINPSWPTISEAKGKILALECSPPTMHFNQLNNNLWAMNWHENPLIYLQDLWDGPDLIQKCNVIEETIEKSSIIEPEILILNHISATNGTLGFPDLYAKNINQYTLDLFNNRKEKNIRGVQIYDFINSNICQSIMNYSCH